MDDIINHRLRTQARAAENAGGESSIALKYLRLRCPRSLCDSFQLVSHFLPHATSNEQKKMDAFKWWEGVANATAASPHSSLSEMVVLVDWIERQIFIAAIKTAGEIKASHMCESGKC